MKSYQDVLNIYDAREDIKKAAEWKQKQADQQRFENAAKEAHKVRMLTSLLYACPVTPWDYLDSCSQGHLIADAKAVEKNPSITERELRELYRNRLVTWGATDHPDLLEANDETSEIIEASALESLKKSFSK